jgi:hypothetical protein
MRLLLGRKLKIEGHGTLNIPFWLLVDERRRLEPKKGRGVRKRTMLMMRGQARPNSVIACL